MALAPAPESSARHAARALLHRPALARGLARGAGLALARRPDHAGAVHTPAPLRRWPVAERRGGRPVALLALPAGRAEAGRLPPRRGSALRAAAPRRLAHTS